MPKVKGKSIIFFNNQQIRRHWDTDKELWFFSVIDVIRILTGSVDPPAYWRKLKERLRKEGNQTVTNCHALKMIAPDGKLRETDCLSTEDLLRLVQSIPSPNTEPMKLWLARIGYERIEETYDPEKAINRALTTYLKKGYSKEWVNQRLKAIEVRKDLTDEWEKRNVKEGLEFAILTDEITTAWTGGMATKDYKKFKKLTKENLRDNMTNLELVLNMLAEATTTEISKEKKPKDFDHNKKIARQGGEVAGNAREDIEQKIGKKVITNKNIRSLKNEKKKKIIY